MESDKVILNFTCCPTTSLFNAVSVLSIIKRMDQAGFYSSLINSYGVIKGLYAVCTLFIGLVLYSFLNFCVVYKSSVL